MNPADSRDCSRCRHAAVLHTGTKGLCVAVFRGAWGPCTCPGYSQEGPEIRPRVRATDLIAAERLRQVEAEGYDAQHDAGHAEELAAAGAVYAISSIDRGPLQTASRLWPWDAAYWKPVPDDRIRELVKAGALIAAAIDALLAEGQR